MNKKKIGIFIGSVVALIIIIFGVYFLFVKQDEKTALTLMDKKWIEDNKNTVIDLGIVNDIPVFSYEGDGLFFALIRSIEKDTGLEFNSLSYRDGEDTPSDYAFRVVDTLDKEDILLYDDNYSLISKENIKYNRLEDIKAMTIGVLESDLENANKYLKFNLNLSFKTYSDISKLSEALSNDEVGAILLPKTICLQVTAKVGTLYNNYNVTEMQKHIVLHLGNNKKLNQIIRKYYKKWSKENFNSLFNSYFSSVYLAMNDVCEQDDTKFRSKNYIYGFVNVAPYDATVNGTLIGTNKELIRAFAKTANVDIKYKEFDSIEDMVKAFNENKIDFMFHRFVPQRYDMDIVHTVSNYDENLVVISSLSNDITVNSLSSLLDKKVRVVKNSSISTILKDLNIATEEYDNMDDMISSFDKNSIAVMDYMTYDVYSKNRLLDFKIDYTFQNSDDYNFIIRDIDENMLFKNYFNFFLSFMNEDSIIHQVTYKDFEVKISNMFAIYALLSGILILCIVFGILLYNRSHNRKKKNNKGKESKLRYIDMLTSLKNRNYLNDSIASWDESDIYPQSIIIVDLNNVAYINDNYGHEEGDRVIAEAANILIRSQIENSEIVRTNGNEFLVYLVAYEEKQVIAYIHKLQKEFKELSHGFGAAIGYSMVYDAIKTIDDAINEATLDMKSNKEEANN